MRPCRVDLWGIAIADLQTIPTMRFILSTVPVRLIPDCQILIVVCVTEKNSVPRERTLLASSVRFLQRIWKKKGRRENSTCKEVWEDPGLCALCV